MAYRREPRPAWDCQPARPAGPYVAGRYPVAGTGFDDDEAETVALRRPGRPVAYAGMNATRQVPIPSRAPVSIAPMAPAPSRAPVPRPELALPRELLTPEPAVPMPRGIAIRPIWVITALLLLAISYRVLPYATARVNVVDTTLDRH